MKRREIVATLMIEGFSEKTLVTLSDKELRILSNRILGEQMAQATTSTPNPGEVTPVTNVSRNDVATQNALKQQKKPFSTYESEMGEEKEMKNAALVKRISHKIEHCKDPKKAEHLKDLLSRLERGKVKDVEGVSLNEWVNKIVEKNVHPFTSKSDIMSLVQNKLNEQEVMEPEKKAQVPPFLSYDEIKNMEADVEVAPAQPKVVPGTRPTTDPGKKPGKDNPYKPGPGKNPKPKAQTPE